MITGSAYAQTKVVIPTKASEDKEAIMSAGYWAIQNDEEQKRIDADIEKHRKADATFKVGKIKKGSSVKVTQTTSEFVFGASAFNWDQLGSKEMNTTYKELFGKLFNRATIPFFWNKFEQIPGDPRFSPKKN